MSSFSFRALTSQAPLVFEMWTNFFLEYRRHWRQFSKNWMMSSLIKLMASQIKLIWSGKWFKVKLKFSRVSSMYLVESSCSSWIKSLDKIQVPRYNQKTCFSLVQACPDGAGKQRSCPRLQHINRNGKQPVNVSFSSPFTPTTFMDVACGHFESLLFWWWSGKKWKAINMGFFRSFRVILERSQGKITFSFLKSPIQNPREVFCKRTTSSSVIFDKSCSDSWEE